MLRNRIPPVAFGILSALAMVASAAGQDVSGKPADERPPPPPGRSRPGPIRRRSPVGSCSGWMRAA
ncbi:MAG: hypothetical protein WKF75_09045 [Singulisphaera sp.]